MNRRTSLSGLVLTGSCPQRSESGGIPALPLIVSGNVLLGGAPAEGGVQVIAVMAHPSQGLCWISPVQTSASGTFNVTVSPPAVNTGWFPVRFFVDGEEATVEPPVGLEAYSPGGSVTVALLVD
ncbi:MAG: hypothetical protein WD533_07900 [Dehalococcoidia bacterium]